MSRQKVTDSNDTSSTFPIVGVGVGASAGGLEALEKFLKHVPAGYGMAFVVIQHLDPDHICMLSELLKRVTTMMVLELMIKSA